MRSLGSLNDDRDSSTPIYQHPVGNGSSDHILNKIIPNNHRSLALQFFQFTVSKYSGGL